MITQESLNIIDLLINEGRTGITPKDVRLNAANNLEGEMQAQFFAMERERMVSKTAHMTMKVGYNESANKLFTELMKK